VIMILIVKTVAKEMYSILQEHVKETAHVLMLQMIVTNMMIGMILRLLNG